MGADFHIRGDTKLDSSGFSKGIDKLGSVAKAGMGVLAKAGAAAVTALGAAGVAAIKVGSDFEAAMSEVQAISGATGSDLEKLSDAAKEMGATTKFSASESAEALKYMAMAGWDTEEMLNGLPGVINLAAASGEALGTVSDIVTDAMTAFGLSTEETSRFVDVLAQTANKSNTNVAMLGESFQYVAPVAGALGFSIEDTAVALGLMANSGIKASQAGTSLRTLFTNLTNPVGQSAKAIEALGISIQNSDGSMKSFSEIMGDLRGEFSKMTEAEKAQYAAMLAGQEGMSGLLAIVNASDSDFQDLAASIAQSNGAAEEMAQTMQNNLQGSITSFRSAAEGLGIAIYEGIKDKVKNTVDIGTDMLRQLREGFEQGGVEGLISAATNVVGQLLNGFVNSAPSLIDAGVQILMMVLNGIATLIPTLPQQSQSIITALANGIFTLLPTLLIVGGQLILSLLQGLSQALPNILNSGSQTLQSFISGALSGFSELANLALNILLTLVQALISSLPTLIPAALQMVFVLIDTLMNNLDKIVQTGIQLLVSLAKGFADTYPQLIAKIPILIGQLIGKLISYLPEILAAGIEIVLTLLAGIVQAFPDLIFQIPTLLKQIWDEIINYDWLAAGDRVIKSLQDGIEAAWDGLVGWFNGIWDGLFGNRTANVTVNTHENRTVSTSYQSSGGAGRRSVNGSHRSGLDYVPFDGYIAELHKGEMVLTSQQAGLWRNGIAQRMLSAASSVMLANQSRSPVLATAGAPAVPRQTAATVQTQHTTVIDLDGRTVAKVITPFVDQFLF